MVALVATLATMLTALLATPAAAAEALPDYAIDNGHFYTQGSGGQKGGFSITDDGGVPMWSEYNRLGGVDTLGYPISGRFLMAGQVVQLTQKVGMVWHPEAGQVRFLNIFSLMHDVGKDGWLASVKGIPPQASSPDEAGKPWDEVAQKRYKLLDVHTAVKDAYFGIVDPVNMYGLPSSGWQEQPTSSVLRFEKVAFQQWKELVPWAKPGQVQLANGGDILKDSGMLGPDPFAAQAPPPAAPLTVTAGFATISFYADSFIGSYTSAGQQFTQTALTCASNAFPLGTRLRLTSTDGKHSVIVMNNDRPPSWNSRIDLTKAAFSALYPISTGVATVQVEVVK
jgi:hypothetical protein